MADIDAARATLLARILDGDGAAPPAQRKAAFADAGLDGPLGALAHKTATRAHDVGDDDFAAAGASGASEDQLFELVICAAVGAASRQWDAALAALDAATATDATTKGAADASRGPR